MPAGGPVATPLPRPLCEAFSCLGSGMLRHLAKSRRLQNEPALAAQPGRSGSQTVVHAVPSAGFIRHPAACWPWLLGATAGRLHPQPGSWVPLGAPLIRGNLHRKSTHTSSPLSQDQQTDKRISSFAPIIIFADLEYQKASFYHFTGEERSALFLSP